MRFASGCITSTGAFRDGRTARVVRHACRWLTIALCFGSGATWAAQTNITISMTAPPAVPRIQTPTVVGGRPGTPFLFTIPATGQAPLTFAASGLPAGLTLTTSSGTIAGTMPAAGVYPVAVTVSNAAGSVQGTLTLNSGNTLSFTPPLGWNSYDSFGAGVRESEMIAAAQAQKTQLQPFGYHFVVVDYLWFDSEQNIDSNGRYLPSPGRFPSATGSLGFKPLADKVHALGLGFGIHIMRGIPRKTVTANSPIAGSSYTASQAANTSSTCPWDNHMYGVRGDTAAGQAWYDSIFAQYAAWEIDFVKVDDLLNNQVNPHVYHQAEVDAIRKAIDKTGRSIVLSLSPGPMLTSSAVNLNSNANMWRMVNDFWDTNGLSTLADVFDASNAWQAVSGITVGHWPDADMLPLGYLGPRVPVHAAGPTALSHNQQVTVMSLWSILPSPLMFGGNVPALTTDATGPWTVALLTNEEVLAVNQDALGTRAKRISAQGNLEVWAKDLSGGAKAVALFNRTSQDAMVSATFAQLGISGTPTIRDLWRRVDVNGMTSSLSVNVPYNGALMYKLSPAGSGAGGSGGGGSGVGGGNGTGGGGAQGGTGGAAIGTGGRSASDGGVDAPVAGSGGITGNGTGGGASSGGSSGSSGGTGASSSGGASAGTGGGVGSGGTASGGATGLGSGGAKADAGVVPAGGNPGCGCGLATGAGGRSPFALLGALLAFGTTLRARRRIGQS